MSIEPKYLYARIRVPYPDHNEQRLHIRRQRYARFDIAYAFKRRATVARAR